MIRVLLESPWSGDVERNARYARACLRDSLARGEAPIASHVLWAMSGALNDDDPEHRAKGISAGLAWLPVAEKMVAYIDYGMSPGMEAAVHKAYRAGIPVELREIYQPRPITRAKVDAGDKFRSAA